jgi:hypothetical protein
VGTAFTQAHDPHLRISASLSPGLRQAELLDVLRRVRNVEDETVDGHQAT